MKKSITVEFWNAIYYMLSFVSLFKLVTIFLKNRNSNWWYRFVDIWVLGHLFLALSTVFFIRYINYGPINQLFVFYGFLRVFEIVVYQINVLLFDEYRAKKKGQTYRIRGYRRMILNLFNNFAEIIFWFAASYALFTGALSEAEMSIGRLLFNSFCVMTTFGMPNLTILTETGLYILWFQCFAGLLMTLLSIAKFIGMMPNVETLDEFEH